MAKEEFKCPNCGTQGFRLCAIGPLLGKIGDREVRNVITMCVNCDYSESKETVGDKK